MIIALAADHAGFPLKSYLCERLHIEKYRITDLGTLSADSVDYPDFAHALCRAVEENRVRFGILICGTGTGMSIAANRHPHIRCVLAHDVTTARLGREHEDANVLALGGRLLANELAWEIVVAFLGGSYEGGRHARRLDKLNIPAGSHPA